MRIGDKVLLWITVGAISLIVITPALVTKDVPQRHPFCLSNVKQLAIGLVMYESDEDRLPFRDGWMDGIVPYEKMEGLFHCPDVAKGFYGYSFNGKLDRMPLAKFPSPETMPMVYDSVNLARNASDLYTSLPPLGRHTSTNSVGFGDGHAKALRTP